MKTIYEFTIRGTGEDKAEAWREALLSCLRFNELKTPVVCKEIPKNEEKQKKT